MDKISIIQKENKILRQQAKEVPLDSIKSAEIRNIIKKLKQAIAENEEAVAIAAPQIGKSLRIFAVSEYIFNPKMGSESLSPSSKKDFGFLIFINPKILKKSKKQKTLTEGCLSASNIYGAIKRAEKIKIEAYGENGKKFIKSGAGLFSQVIQHEIDHLDGILFTDKAIMTKSIVNICTDR
jgi:peptide deformylase